MTMQPVGRDHIKAFRKRMGWTQAQLAEAVGVSRRAVEVWESPDGNAPPMLRFAFTAIAAGLGPWPSD